MIHEKHIAMTSQNDIADICAPLFAHSPLTFFIYLRCYDDGRTAIMTTNNQWIAPFFKKQYPITSPAPSSLISPDFSYLLSDEGPYSTAYKDAKHLLGIDNVLDIISRKQDYYDMFCFASDINSPDTLNFYVNQIDFLKKFGHYFKEKTNALLADSLKTPLMTPESMRPNFGGTANEKTSNSLSDTLANIINLTSYTLEINGNKIKLYNREIQCLRLLIKGHSAKTTANILNLSPRTVEGYLASIREKLSCRNRSELMKTLLNTPLWHFIIEN